MMKAVYIPQSAFCTRRSIVKRNGKFFCGIFSRNWNVNESHAVAFGALQDRSTSSSEQFGKLSHLFVS